jgi:excisionase family DNA binding protein
MQQKAAAMTSPHHLLSLEQASRVLGIGIRTLRGLIASGKLNVVHVSARRRAVHPDDLDRYIRDNRR